MTLKVDVLNISPVQKKGCHVKVLLLTGGERGGDKEIRLAAVQSNRCIICFAGFEDGKLSDTAESVSWIEKKI